MKDYSKETSDSPFKVPEDYFETLADRIDEKIQEEENPQKEPIIRMLKPYLWMAASILGFVLVAKLILTTVVGPEYKIKQISQADTQQVESPIPTQLEEDNFFLEGSTTTTDEIIEYLSDEDIDTDILIANL